MASHIRPGRVQRCKAAQPLRAGFTLVELLVVILIISVLIIALIPVVRNAQQKAKEQAVRTNCAGIEAALSVYAQNHGGNFPGVAIDVMSPLRGQALGDPDLYNRPVGLDFPSPGEVSQAVIGAEGHRNLNATALTQQLRDAKNTQLVAGNIDYPRYFDELMRSGAIQDYPHNPFSGFGQNTSMRNIFGFRAVPTALDFTDIATLNDPDNFETALLVPEKPIVMPGLLKSIDPVTNRAWITHMNYALPVLNFIPEAFSDSLAFGPGEDKYFSPGDFAYVPILSESAYSQTDDGVTLRNESYLWGTQVSGYLLFGYGSGEGQDAAIRKEQEKFAETGLPGYGAPGVDTRHELIVLQCFEGAVYFNRS
ncbi:prepilin-type N-terminal cleavage/methylation domain-containing protein [bacterium]|nr:prepilin-type N-terminal cleavage/methylation domain-containing protein [bacterium]